MNVVGHIQPRVVHLDDGRLWRGGQHQVFLLVSELAERGVAQQLVTPPGSPLGIRARGIGVDVIEFNFRGEWDMFGPRRLAEKIGDFRPNIIHAHTGHAHAVALRIGRRLGARVLSTRRVDFAVGGNFFSRRKYGYPGQHFIAISSAVRQVLIDGGVAPARIDIVHSGVPALDPAEMIPREEVRRQLGIGADEIAIVNIGALTDHKGQRWLVEAAPRIFEKLPTARVHIIGEGELRDALQSQIEQLGLEGRVLLHGWVEEVRRRLWGFDLFVSSSHLEGLGTVILDAMLARLPVVAAAAGGVVDVVFDGETGRLVVARDSAALAGAVIAAVEDRSGSIEMAGRAIAAVGQKFSARAMAGGTLTVYEKLIRNFG